jgi:hypothetical protein
MYPNKHFQLYFLKFILHMWHILWASFARISNVIYTSTLNTSCYFPCSPEVWCVHLIVNFHHLNNTVLNTVVTVNIKLQPCGM